MEAIGLLVTLEARAGKEADAEAFLKSAQPLALNEKTTLKWYAIEDRAGEVRHLRHLWEMKRASMQVACISSRPQ